MSSYPRPEMRAEIAERMGVVPSFFSIGGEAAGMAEFLWPIVQAAYLDNPLPSLFKERLIVYTSRYCPATYCVARHAAFLTGRGNPSGDRDCVPLSVDEVSEMLIQHRIKAKRFVEDAAKLSQLEQKLDQWPEPKSAIEECIFSCAVAVFLSPHSAVDARTALYRALPTQNYYDLMRLISFIRATHFWTEISPQPCIRGRRQ